jgi:hypothetical protein
MFVHTIAAGVESSIPDQITTEGVRVVVATSAVAQASCAHLTTSWRSCSNR